MRDLKVLIVGFFILTPFAGNADVIITYADLGSDLVFNYSGTLDADASYTGTSGGLVYATVGVQNSGNSPTFYSANGFWGGVPDVTYLGANNPGLFATNAPSFTSVMPGSTASGTVFLFRVNRALTGTTSVNVWGDWGSAGSLINGSLTIAGQSRASLGLVDGYMLDLNIGSITFRDATHSVPEPGTLTLLGLGLAGIGAMRRRKTA